jgi:hypothetical protein
MFRYDLVLAAVYMTGLTWRLEAGGLRLEAGRFEGFF